MDYTQIILALVGLISGGSIFKLFTIWQKYKESQAKEAVKNRENNVELKKVALEGESNQNDFMRNMMNDFYNQQKAIIKEQKEDFDQRLKDKDTEFDNKLRAQKTDYESKIGDLSKKYDSLLQKHEQETTFFEKEIEKRDDLLEIAESTITERDQTIIGLNRTIDELREIIEEKENRNEH